MRSMVMLSIVGMVLSILATVLSSVDHSKRRIVNMYRKYLADRYSYIRVSFGARLGSNDVVIDNREVASRSAHRLRIRRNVHQIRMC